MTVHANGEHKVAPTPKPILLGTPLAEGAKFASDTFRLRIPVADTHNQVVNVLAT